jgi:hypothetical protein
MVVIECNRYASCFNDVVPWWVTSLVGNLNSLQRPNGRPGNDFTVRRETDSMASAVLAFFRMVECNIAS